MLVYLIWLLRHLFKNYINFLVWCQTPIWQIRKTWPTHWKYMYFSSPYSCPLLLLRFLCLSLTKSFDRKHWMFYGSHSTIYSEPFEHFTLVIEDGEICVDYKSFEIFFVIKKRKIWQTCFKKGEKKRGKKRHHVKQFFWAKKTLREKVCRRMGDV